MSKFDYTIDLDDGTFFDVEIEYVFRRGSPAVRNPADAAYAGDPDRCELEAVKLERIGFRFGGAHSIFKKVFEIELIPNLDEGRADLDLFIWVCISENWSDIEKEILAELKLEMV